MTDSIDPPKRARPVCALCMALFTTIAVPGGADAATARTKPVVVRAAGMPVRGVVLEVTENEVVLETGSGERRLPLSQLTPADLVKCRRILLDVKDVSAVLALAEYCLANGLGREGESILGQAARLDPDTFREVYEIVRAQNAETAAKRVAARPKPETKRDAAPRDEFPADQLPTVFWHSQPVRANQTLMLSGANFAPGAIVEIARLPDDDPGRPGRVDLETEDIRWMRLRPVQVTDHTLSVVLPGGKQWGVYAYRVRVGKRVGRAKLVNAPEPWFASGDLGETASPRGWIGVFGTCMSLSAGKGTNTRERAPAARIALAYQGRVVTVLDAREADGTRYGQYFDMPGRLQGTFSIYIHNGHGGPAAWVRYEGMTSDGRKLKDLAVAPRPAWPDRACNVAEQRGANDDERFVSAVSRCSGGGVVLVPAGTYTLTKQIRLSNRTVLRGAGMDETVLRWTKQPGSGGKGPSLVKGRNISVEDLTIENAAGESRRCIETHGGAEPRHIRNVRIKTRNGPGLHENAAPAILMGGSRNLAVIDCDIDVRSGITLHGWEGGPNQFIRIEGNTIRWRTEPFRPIFSNSQVIYRGNNVAMAGTFGVNGYTEAMNPNPGDWYGTWGFNIRDFYYAENVSSREEEEPTHGSIGLTWDGGQGVYWGKVVKTRETSMTLASSTSTPTGIPGSCDRGAVVRIVDGRGTGQIRHLMSPATRQGDAPGAEIVIDRPWDIEPDESSWLSISDYQGRTLYVRNEFGNHPLLQIYFGTHDIVFAENTFGVPGKRVTMPIWVGVRSGGLATGWHYQVLDNTIRHAGIRFITNVNTEGLPSGYDGALTGMHVYRGNVSAVPGAPFELRYPRSTEGVIIEGNRGITRFDGGNVDDTTGVLRGNLGKNGSRLSPSPPGPGVVVVR